MIDLATAQRDVAHYQRVQGLLDWTFTVSIVPGLQFDGVDAWATVQPDVKRKHADVKVRDTDATPIPGFDGDPNLERRLTISHELWHCWTAPIFGGTDNAAAIAYEERFVEAAARAVVLSEGTRDQAVMARSVQAIPNRIRARLGNISALATRQRIAGRNRNVDPKMIEEIIAAIKEGNGEAAIELLTKLLASAAGGVVGGNGAARDGAAEESKDKGAEMAAARDTETPMMARARIAIDGSIAKADKAARVSAEIATRARIKELRADGVTIDEASAASLVKLGDIDAVEERIGWMLKGRETSTERARSGVLSQDGEGGSPSVAGLIKDGHSAEMAGHIAAEFKRGAEHGKTALDAAMKFRKAGA
jgi:hypothetical protein